MTKRFSILSELNEYGATPLYVAWNSKNLTILRLFLDLYLYGKHPSMPIVANIVLLNLSIFTLKKCGISYHTVMTIPVLYFIADIFNQNNVTNKTSKIAFGLNLGLIIAIMTTYCSYLMPIVSYGCSVYIFCNLFAIIVTLYFTSTSSHNWVSDNNDRRIRDQLVSWGGKVEGIQQNIDKYEKRQDNVCHICLIDKPRELFHCYRCGTCVLEVDHHCDFVNNCIDKDNRRVFILFTFVASLGCFICSIIAFSMQEQLLKHENMDTKTDFVFHHHMITVTDKIIAFFRIEIFLFMHYPDYFVVNWMSLLVSIWIFFIFIGQVFMVMNNTTTYKVIKGHYRGSYFPENLVNGIQNLVTFLIYGYLPLNNLSLSQHHDHHHHHDCNSHSIGIHFDLRS